MKHKKGNPVKQLSLFTSTVQIMHIAVVVLPALTSGVNLHYASVLLQKIKSPVITTTVHLMCTASELLCQAIDSTQRKKRSNCGEGKKKKKRKTGQAVI